MLCEIMQSYLFLWCLDVFSVDLSRLESEDSTKSLPCSSLLTVSRLECFLRCSMSCRRSIESPLCVLPLAYQRETKENSDVADFGLIQNAAQLPGQTELVMGAQRWLHNTPLITLQMAVYDETEHRTIHARQRRDSPTLSAFQPYTP